MQRATTSPYGGSSQMGYLKNLSLRCEDRVAVALVIQRKVATVSIEDTFDLDHFIHKWLKRQIQNVGVLLHLGGSATRKAWQQVVIGDVRVHLDQHIFRPQRESGVQSSQGIVCIHDDLGAGTLNNGA